MSVLLVGLSHKSAPVAVLERAAVSGDTLAKLLVDLARAEPVAETFVISTCNRLEVYADVDRFHAGVTAVCELVARHGGIPAEELTPHLHVHYEDRAVSHLLTVACGLDSVAVGEEQILGQVRSAIRLAAEHGAIGRALGDLGRLALRAGKRARAETGIARTGGTLLSLAIEAASASPPTPAGTAVGASLAGRDVLVVSAGTMSALAVATASRDGAASLVLVNRTRRRAERLAARSGVAPTRPRDVEPTVARLPGVAVIGLDMLAQQGTVAGGDDIAAVHAIMEAEVATYQSAADAARVAPTVVALLHAPTVRVKELAGSPGGEEYAVALRVLFDLDPRAVEAVTRAAPEQEAA